MHLADDFQMRLERRDQLIGEHGNAVFESLAVMNEDHMLVEIDILHAQAQDFHKAQTAPVEQLGHEQMLTGEPAEDAMYLLFREHGGQAEGTLGADELEGSIETFLQDVAEKENQSVQCLVLGGRGDLLADGEVGEEGRDLRLGEPLGRERGLECQKASDPIDVGLLGADGIMFTANDGVETVEAILSWWNRS